MKGVVQKLKEEKIDGWVGVGGASESLMMLLEKEEKVSCKPIMCRIEQVHGFTNVGRERRTQLGPEMGQHELDPERVALSFDVVLEVLNVEANGPDEVAGEAEKALAFGVREVVQRGNIR